MPRNSFVQMSKLHNVRGRIYYISSDKKQENLYAVYETTDRKFWTELAKCNQAEFKKSGTEGKCIEAREFIIALPESFVDYPPDGLLKYMTDKFKSRYGVDCIAALHHNKRKTNYHIHLIFAERNYLDEPIEKIATRNMFYDEKGNHVRMNPMSKQTRNGTPSMEKTQSIESWQKNRQKFRNGNRTEILTIVRHQTEELDNLIKFKKDKDHQILYLF